MYTYVNISSLFVEYLGSVNPNVPQNSSCAGGRSPDEYNRRFNRRITYILLLLLLLVNRSTSSPAQRITTLIEN